MMAEGSSKSLMIYGALAGSVLLNLMFWMRGPSKHESEAPVAAAPATSEAAPADSAPAAQPAAVAAAPAAAESATAAASGEWQTLHAKVEQSLARSFQIAVGEDGDALSSVYTRLFVWDLDLRRDMQNGDALSVVWRKGADGLPEIAAASLQSKKLGKTVEAYRWQAPGDKYASYWHPDGSEAPLRLKNGPLDDYEQITSLLKDRPTHKGMDFKTPLGSEVRSPKSGVVTRVNWNWTANGNCIEVRYEDGTLAKFLHLSENKVTEGSRVGAGQVIALSGNTGHSTAPHLHYQLNGSGDKVIDPLDYHGTLRRSLPPEQVATLQKDTATYRSMIGASTLQ